MSETTTMGGTVASDKDFVECKDWGLFHRQRKTVTPYWAVIGAVLLGLALALYFVPWAISKANAAPKADDAEECVAAADMALVARALAESTEPRVPAASAEAVMLRIYNVAENEHGLALMRSVLATAYQIDVAPKDYAAQLMRACVRGRGDMDGILGSDV
jgi:hypothetical protein